MHRDRCNGTDPATDSVPSVAISPGFAEGQGVQPCLAKLYEAFAETIEKNLIGNEAVEGTGVIGFHMGVRKMSGEWWVDPKDLDEYQQAAIVLPLDENHLVTGPPGSGKTNLLMLRSTHLIRSGTPNIKMLVFNRTLEEFIASCTTPYSLPRDKLSTIQGWEMELINQLEVGHKRVGPSWHSEANCRILGELVLSQNLQHLYDVILIDECQDYLKEEVEIILRLAKTVFAAGDQHQQIYDHENPIPFIASHCMEHRLPHHYRNGHRIRELAMKSEKTGPTTCLFSVRLSIRKKNCLHRCPLRNAIASTNNRRRYCRPSGIKSKHIRPI